MKVFKSEHKQSLEELTYENYKKLCNTENIKDVKVSFLEALIFQEMFKYSFESGYKIGHDHGKNNIITRKN